MSTFNQIGLTFMMIWGWELTMTMLAGEGEVLGVMLVGFAGSLIWLVLSGFLSLIRRWYN